MEVGDLRAEFGRSQGIKQDWPGRGPVSVCRWRGLSQAGVVTRSEQSKEQGALGGWTKGPARAGPGNPWARLQNRPWGQSSGGRKVFGEDWQALVPLGRAGPTTEFILHNRGCLAPPAGHGSLFRFGCYSWLGFQCSVAGTPPPLDKFRVLTRSPHSPGGSSLHPNTRPTLSVVWLQCPL